jgi:hypothetical protein
VLSSSAGTRKALIELVPQVHAFFHALKMGISDSSLCGRNPAKIGPDNDSRPGGCDNVLISIDRAGAIAPGYNRISD